MPSILNPAAYHILSYGTLLGTSVFNTFIAGIVSFKVLPRPSFSVLQQKLFPYYFGMQTILPLTCLLSYPIASLASLSAPPHRAHVLIPLAAMSILGATNWLWIGPWTTRVMRERKHQETRDGKRYYDPGEQSEKMRALNKSFSALHGASSLLNVSEIAVTIWYGFVLAERLSVVVVGA